MTSLDTRRHESGHAATARWLDVPVNSINVVYDGAAYGEIRHAFCDIARQVLVILGGMLEYTGELPQWPITEYELADEQALHDLIKTHHITSDDYCALRLIALTTIAADPDYQRLLTITAAALRRQPVIDRHLFNEIAAIA